MRIKTARRTKPWTIAELKQLGKTPDSILARRLVRTIKEVVAERERRRIGLPTAPHRSPPLPAAGPRGKSSCWAAILTPRLPVACAATKAMFKDTAHFSIFPRLVLLKSKNGPALRKNFSAPRRTTKSPNG